MGEPGGDAFMWKKVAFVAVAAALVGSTLVYAQNRPDRGERWRPTAEDMSALTDARIAALKAGLRLTPEQDKNWPAFEQAVRDYSKVQAERRAAWLNRERTWFNRDGFNRGGSDRAGSDGERAPQANEPRAESPIDRLQRRADALSRRGMALKNVADTAAPLYQSLDDAQKRRFLFLARVISSRHQRFARWADDGGSQRSNRMDRGGEELR
jgi:hypothetical protein